MQSYPPKYWLLGLGLSLIVTAALVACGGEDEAVDDPVTDATEPAQDPSPTATPTEASTVAPTPTTVPEVESGDAELAVAALAAIDVVDSAGFHDIATDLAEATEINPRLSGTVNNVLTVVQATTWDSALESDSSALIESLENLAAALADEDLEAARSAAEEIHDIQHDLSNATYAWLKTAPSVDASDEDTAIMSVIAAVDVIDSAGFHDMATDLAEATEINPRHAGAVDQALTAAKLAGWSGDVATPASQLISDLEDLLAALEAEELEPAAAAAEAIHGSQHDTSKAAYSWLASNHPMMSHDNAVLATACDIKAVDAVDSAGFHDMAQDLADATEINPRYAGQVSNALAVLAMEPDGTPEAMMHLSEQMAALHAALEEEDLETARELAETVHDDQHDFSHEMYGQMGAMHGTS